MPVLVHPRAMSRRAVSLLVALTLSLFVLSASPPTASAGAELTVTSTSTTSVPPNALTPLDGVTVTGDVDPDDIVLVTVTTDRGTVGVLSTSGLTLAPGGHWAGDPSFTFTGGPSDVNAALATLGITTGNDAGTTAAVSVSALRVTASSSYHYSPSTGHFYRYVGAGGLNRAGAEDAAALLTYRGQPGYLASIPNTAVNDLVTSISPDINVWFGAESEDQSFDFPGRVWKWTGGPLVGDTLTECSFFGASCIFSNDGGLYHNWYPGQPDNVGGTSGGAGDHDPHSGEWAAVTNYNGHTGQWGDVDGGDGFSDAMGYVVEFGDLSYGASSWRGSVSASSDVAIASGPAAPTSVAAVGHDASATVTFTPPTDTTGITGYVVTSSPGGVTASCASSPCDVSGLTNGTSYTFTVHSVTATETSAESAASNAVTPALPPGRPTVLTFDGGDGSATVTFSAPASNGGSAITSYTLTASPGNHTGTCSSSPCVVTGLTNGTSYELTLVATNGVGSSDPTDAVPVMPAAAPGAPTGVSVVPGNGSATVSFTAPADDGGNAILHYTVTSAPGGLTAQCPGSPCTVTGLTNGTSYEFTVVAVNEIGTSLPSSATSPVTPVTVPTAPVSLTVDRDNGSAALTFIAPADDGGSAITSYEVSKNGGDTWSTLSTSGSAPITATLTGLSNGTAYDIKVRAVNEVGAGPGTDATGVTPADEPDVATGVSAVRGNGRATVAFTPPADNGSPITLYTVTSFPDGKTGTCSTSPCLVRGLSNGTSYQFRVVATNDVGNSDESDLSNAVTPASTPFVPTDLTVVSAAGSAVLSFGEPADGGDPITGYEVSTDGGETWAPLTTSGTSPITATVTGLGNGTSYDVQVRAVNSVGTGEETDSVSVTPATVPTAPRAVHVAVHDGEVTVSWLAPSFDGGSPITFYGVVADPGGQICIADSGTSCSFDNLPTGITYTFQVFALNGVETKSGTGESEPGTSEPTLVSALPGVPQNLAVSAGDRTLGLRFDPPASNGGTPVTRYQVSLDGGHSWTTVTTKGTAHLTATVGGVRNGKAFQVQVRAVSAVGAGPGTASVAVATGSWFTDPVSKADRAKEVAVPTHPSRYRGPVKHTRATYRSRNATIAYPAAKLAGRQLQSGQAVNLTAYFAPHSAKLTTVGKAQVKATAKSLRYVSAITCEGYTDYTGTAKGQRTLGLARAATVCSALRSYAHQVTSRTVLSFGGSRPVVIASHSKDRAANRRVVVLIRT